MIYRDLHKPFKKTGIKLEEGPCIQEDGSALQGYWFHYGQGMGATWYATLEEGRANALHWIVKRRKRLVAEAAELEQVERFLNKLEG